MSEIFARVEMNYVGSDAAHPVKVDVRDGRREAPGKWEDAGFELQTHRSAVKNWDDAAEIERLHYPEISQLAQQLTGCDHALVGGHIRRNPEQATLHSDLSPITFVHSDFAPSYRDVIHKRYESPSPEAAASLNRAGLTAADVAGASRMIILQFWRNTGPGKMDFPIAFCDARTVGPDELAVIDVTDYAGGGTDFQTLGIHTPADAAAHKWYTFPEMDETEVVIFRTYDSAMVDQQQPFWTPHSAFRDPDVAVGKPSRRSIELRATCLFN